MLNIKQQTYEMISLDKIVSTSPIRPINESGKTRIRESIRKSGFLNNFPLLVMPRGDGTFEPLDGNHRLVASEEEGLAAVPCVIITDLSEVERYRIAIQCNNAAETVVPQTMATYAELIWKLVDEGYTQEKIAEEVLQWGREKVAKYVMLRGIKPEVWQLIVPTFENLGTGEDNDTGTKNVPTGTLFSEGLLRSILSLTLEQQLELVTALITQKDFTKKKFKELAEDYQARNEAKEYALQKLGDIGEEYTSRLEQEIDKGAYDTDWKKSETHPKLHKLIESLTDEWEQKNNTQRIHGDFFDEVRKIEDACIDLIITDPPYNIANDRIFDPEGRAAFSQDYGEWDKYTKKDFLELFPKWCTEWWRILKPQGSGYVFVADRYLSHLRDALEETGFQIKSTLTWHKTNPGTQNPKTNYKSSVEFILFFTKGEGGHTFNWLGDKGSIMHNFIEHPICEGKERLDDAKGKTLHPTQKPEGVIRHLMERSSNPGDTVFDGFAGVFTTAKVAKDSGRKSISIEKELTFYEAGKHRLEGGK